MQSQKNNIKNEIFDNYILGFGKERDVDWVCDLLERASGSPVFTDDTNKKLMIRLGKPVLK